LPRAASVTPLHFADIIDIFAATLAMPFATILICRHFRYAFRYTPYALASPNDADTLLSRCHYVYFATLIRQLRYFAMIAIFHSYCFSLLTLIFARFAMTAAAVYHIR